jgi:hypothetical protein
MKSFSVVVIGVLCGATSAFVPSSPRPHRRVTVADAPPVEAFAFGAERGDVRSSSLQSSSPFALSASRNQDSDSDRFRPLLRLWRQGRRLVKPAAWVSLALLTTTLATNRPAEASAPVMALPKAENRDPISEYMAEHQRKVATKTQAELKARDQQAREIEATEGEAARMRFEKQWQAQREEEAATKTTDLEKLKRSLLDQGVDPFIDLEGQRQVMLLEKGIDLAEVQGTAFSLEVEYERKTPQKSQRVQKQANRKMIASIVQDQKNRGLDPLEYFEKHQERTMSILDLPASTAASIAQEYQTNLEEYGQITIPKEGEVSAKERLAMLASDPKTQKAEAKAKAQAAKAEAKLAKEAAKQEAAAKKAAAKQEASVAKAAAKAAAAAAAVAAAASAGAANAAAGTAANIVAGSPEASIQATVMGEAGSEQTLSTEDDAGAMAAPSTVASTESSTKKQGLPVAPAAGAVVVALGGGYGLKLMREKSERQEEERQRQFRLLMGGDSVKEDQPRALEEIDSIDAVFDEPSPASVAPPAAAPIPAPVPKKRRLGIFNKKKSDRATELSELVSSESKASVFATLLAKILSYGAPGRFPTVLALTGNMPMESFDLDLGKQLLVEARTAGDLTTDESAESFANVVNCMLIEIVDLASTSLKEKDPKITVDAINIVVEYMNHAASLYDAVAGEATIKPVVYEGSLSKSKLEQMYSAYAVSGMMDMENVQEDFDGRVHLLQDVFQINEKKAEGLMMKSMQKQMMEMMKDGKGMEDMMGGMAGMEGMEEMMGGLMGGGANGEGMDTQQLMAMMGELKAAKDRGEISNEDLESVKAMFQESFGSSIDNLDESTLSGEDKEVLAMMKSILAE